MGLPDLIPLRHMLPMSTTPWPLWEMDSISHEVPELEALVQVLSISNSKERPSDTGLVYQGCRALGPDCGTVTESEATCYRFPHVVAPAQSGQASLQSPLSHNCASKKR